mmetsp:Transcript_8628/g.27369  ORF Transcript_8628/g.27369 Transcript_8628/m.27369 type:complete len:298 (-) Transcript_8628:46-939(-)
MPQQQRQRRVVRCQSRASIDPSRHVSAARRIEPGLRALRPILVGVAPHVAVRWVEAAPNRVRVCRSDELPRFLAEAEVHDRVAQLVAQHALVAKPWVCRNVEQVLFAARDDPSAAEPARGRVDLAQALALLLLGARLRLPGGGSVGRARRLRHLLRSRFQRRRLCLRLHGFDRRAAVERTAQGHVGEEPARYEVVEHTGELASVAALKSWLDRRCHRLAADVVRRFRRIARVGSFRRRLARALGAERVRTVLRDVARQLLPPNDGDRAPLHSQPTRERLWAVSKHLACDCGGGEHRA